MGQHRAGGGFAAVSTITLLLGLLVLVSPGLAADERQDPMDVIIALDKSLSMEEEIAAVKKYVSTAIVDGLLIPGDLLIVIAFYGKTDILVSTVISDAASRETIKKAIGGIRADGRWTDIGAALDELKSQLEAKGRKGIPKYLLLVTDGKPEPPPTSKYWSPDGSFTHEFLDNTKTIQKEGWKVQVLGVGSAADARELADKLSGIYTQVPDNPTVEQLTETTKEFLGSISVEGTARVSAVGKGGRGTIDLTVKSSGYDAAKSVVVSGIKLTTGEDVRENIASGRQTFEVPPSTAKDISIRFTLQPKLPPGKYRGTFEITYDGDVRVVPAVLDLDFRVSSVLRNNLGFVIPGSVLVVAGVVLLVLLLVRRSGDGKLTFRLVVTEVPLAHGRDLFTLRPGEDRYLEEEADAVSLAPQKSKRSIARVYVTARDLASPVLSFEVLEPKRFVHAKEVPQAVLGAEVVMKTERERKLHLRFEAASPDA